MTLTRKKRSMEATKKLHSTAKDEDIQEIADEVEKRLLAREEVPDKERFVVNRESGCVHRVLVHTHNVPEQEWRSFCGWAFSSGKRYRFHEDSSELEGAKRCVTCWPELRGAQGE